MCSQLEGARLLLRVRANVVFLIIYRSLSPSSSAGGGGVRMSVGVRSDCIPRSRRRNSPALPGVAERVWVLETHKLGFGSPLCHFPAV